MPKSGNFRIALLVTLSKVSLGQGMSYYATLHHNLSKIKEATWQNAQAQEVMFNGQL